MPKNLIASAVIESNDEGLRKLIHERLKVMVKFTADDCPVCKLLAPGFRKFAEDDKYLSILFLRLDCEENPVAKQMMAERSAPFFVSYCQGRILECDTRETEAGMQAQLDRLRAFVPHTA